MNVFVIVCGNVLSFLESDHGDEGLLGPISEENELTTKEPMEDEECDEEEAEDLMEDVDDNEVEAMDEVEGKILRSGAIAERSESRPYGSIIHKCDVSSASSCQPHNHFVVTSIFMSFCTFPPQCLSHNSC